MSVTGFRRSRGAEWVRRYLASEVLGTIAELGSAASAYLITGSLVVAGLAATVGTNVGYYGLNYVRAHRWYLSEPDHPNGPTRAISRPAGTHRMRRQIRACLRASRSILIEFGPGEVIDSVVIRPVLFVVVPVTAVAIAGGSSTWTVVVGWVVAKVLADLVFYACTITSFELNRSRVAGYSASPMGAGER